MIKLSNFSAVILAAGMGTRMKSSMPKVLHRVCGKTLAQWVIDAAKSAGADRVCTIIGHCADMVSAELGSKCEFALQQEQKGTGHAVMQAADFIGSSADICVVLNGDTPLITAEMIKAAVSAHEQEGNAVTVITAVLDNADGYGRIVRNADMSVAKIVEHKDADQNQRKIREINSGMYVFNTKSLLSALDKLSPNNAQGEYYLTDTLEIIGNNNGKIGAFTVGDSDEIRGINDRVQLAEAEAIMQERIRTAHMRAGVTMTTPKSVIIGADVEIGADTILDGSVVLSGNTVIGKGAYIAHSSVIEDSKIDAEARVVGSNIKNSEIKEGADVLNSVLDSAFVDCGTHVGPFAYLRPKSHIGRNVRVGDFVEVKNANIGDGTKISHLTYVGDSDVGERVNFGCGTVTSNYDGKNKFRTVIGDDCFIGCNTNLVAPVSVENGAYIAAGSTITDTVPENSLAIARARQVVKENWTDKRSK